MTENHEDPINAEAVDWDADGLPEQEDATEDQVLPAEEPTAMGEFGSTGTEKEAGEPLDDALAREEPDVPGAGEDEPDPRSAEEAAIREEENPPLI